MTSRPDPLTHLADDRARAVVEGNACSAVWPLLSVPGDALDALDRDTLDVHLDRCARCRAIAVEVWLDGEVAPATAARAALPVAVSLGAPPRRRSPRRLAWLSAAVAAAAAAVAFVGVPAVLGRDDVRLNGVAEDVWVPDPDRPMSIVVVVQGTEPWMGNDTYGPPELPRYPGHHQYVAGALDDLGKALPPGSTVAVLASSARGTEVEWPLAPAEQLSGAALGPQRRYQGRVGAPMLEHSVDLAVALLRQQHGHRVLLIIGDGCPASPEAKTDFGTDLLGQALQRYGISVRALLLDEQQWTWEKPCERMVRALGVRAPRRASHGADLAGLVRKTIKQLRYGR